MRPIFITGIGTDVGKTVVAAIVTEALGGTYWKPVQAGFDQGTDTEWVAARLSNPQARVAPNEAYKLRMPASPHLAARAENIRIDLDEIHRQFMEIRDNAPRSSPYAGNFFIIEGAGGLMVPLNENEFVIDLIKKLNARVILVSRSYLGSINHSLMTAAVCKAHGLDVGGWVFNGEPAGYEKDIYRWSQAKWAIDIPYSGHPDKQFVMEQAAKAKAFLNVMMERP